MGAPSRATRAATCPSNVDVADTDRDAVELGLEVADPTDKEGFFDLVVLELTIRFGKTRRVGRRRGEGQRQRHLIKRRTLLCEIEVRARDRP